MPNYGDEPDYYGDGGIYGSQDVDYEPGYCNGCDLRR